MRVKLGEVAKESRQTLRGSKRGLPVVGLEHIIPSELNLTSRGIDSENTQIIPWMRRMDNATLLTEGDLLYAI